jgi:hypothetical protein
MGVGGQLHTSTAVPREGDPAPNLQGDGWTTGPVRMGDENLAPPGIDPQTVHPVQIC